MPASPSRVAAALVAVGAVAIVGWTLLSSDDAEPATAITSPRPADSAAAVPSEPREPFLIAAEHPDLGPVPEVVDISGWLNTTGESFDEVRGEVTIVQFWTFGCSNCKATLPYLQDLYATRHDAGLEIIGIHAHEFDRERVPENVAAAVADLGVTWPVALDTERTNFRAWQGSRRFWPRTYVIDSQNRVRFDHIGEGAYDELAATVDALLAEVS
jgi:thiol-disulfide isomerase/thioredoxin